MNCEIIREMMSLYIDKEMNDIDKLRFEKHLVECTSCKEELEIMSDIVQNCESMPELELPDNFHEELRGRLLAASRSPMGRIVDFANKYKLKAASSLVAAMLVMAVALNVGPLGGHKKAAMENSFMEPGILSVEDAAMQKSAEDTSNLTIPFNKALNQEADAAVEKSALTQAVPGEEKVQPTSRAVTASPAHTAKAADNQSSKSNTGALSTLQDVSIAQAQHTATSGDGKNEPNKNKGSNSKDTDLVKPTAAAENKDLKNTENKDSYVTTATSTDSNPNTIEPAAGGNAQLTISAPNADISQKVIRRGFASINVKETSNKAQEIELIVEAAGGYMDTSSISTANSVKQVAISVRVPAERFEEVYSSIKKLGVVQTENITSKDITLEYGNAKVRYDELKVQEGKLRELSSKSTDAYEVMKIDSDLSKLKAEAAVFLDKLKEMDRQLQMPLITIEIIENK